MNSTTSAIYNILEWITKFAYVNLLWIIFTLVGGVILGFYPSTIAMFAMVRDWLRGTSDLPVLKTFWKYYKRDFLKSNLLGIFVNIILAMIAIDIYFIQLNMNEQLTWTYIPLFAFMLIVALFLFYLFPSFSHFDLKVGQLMKNTFLIMLISPIQSFLIIISLVSVFFIMRAIPALFFIFGGTTYAFITTWLGLHAFNRIQQKHENT
ncbi:YesL family protein [Oceanobacillus bengalensis]|uniref:DUF624 domain-containing protein n=1 Tax=Oceanobacillus bengalensis TaxID=1435466 RepID=A0A494Z113_9BACI|nr:DUF624 domain-containing protein [Oceanobacillus bengalensis]RKQ15666.1 DUF624 domain-containing protein [Oceanobacillus bengalensis]